MTRTTTKERLSALSSISKGWVDGPEEGEAVSPKALERARRVLRWLPRGYIYPTPEGGVQWEYDMDNWCVSISFDARGRVDVHFVEIEHK